MNCHFLFGFACFASGFLVGLGVSTLFFLSIINKNDEIAYRRFQKKWSKGFGYQPSRGKLGRPPKSGSGAPKKR